MPTLALADDERLVPTLTWHVLSATQKVFDSEDEMEADVTALPYGTKNTVVQSCKGPGELEDDHISVLLAVYERCYHSSSTRSLERWHGEGRGVGVDAKIGTFCKDIES